MTSSNWPQIIKDLMKEHNISGRELCIAAGITRSVFRKYLSGRRSFFTVAMLERVLAFFGYDLEAIKIPDREH